MKKWMLILSCLFLSIGFLFAQSTQITGTVVDDTGEPVTGASVVVKGTTTGTITDFNGKFTINVPKNVKTLMFSLIGMKTIDVAVAPVMRVVMQDDQKMLSEVVVTALGIERQERSLGYSMTTVKADEAQQKAEPDLMRALEGKIPGVNISASSGAAGSATRMTIRGNSSLLGNNQPLYVVDGVPYSNPETETTDQAGEAGGAYGSGLSTLDPNDIESMSVLKGGAAAALYGSRAANGVIVITTKSGSKNRKGLNKGLEVALNSSYTIEKVTGLPDYQNKFGQGNNFMPSASNGSWGAAFTDVTEIPLSLYASGGYLAYYPELGESIPYKAYKNNVKDLFDTGGMYDLSANITSYNDKGSFSATLSKVDQDSYIPHSDFYRYSISVGGNQKLQNGLQIGGNVSYSKTEQNGALYGNNQSDNIGASSFARALILARSWDMSLPNETPSGESLFFVGSQADNPLWSWKNNKTSTTMERVVANVNTAYNITDKLSVAYSLGVNNFNMKRKEIINKGSRALGGLGRISDDSYKSEEIESLLVFNFKTKISDDFSIDAHLGHNVNQLTTNRYLVRGSEINASGIYNINNTKAQVAEELNTRRRLWAIFGDATVQYKNYAFLTLSGRNDWSSTLPKSNRDFFYPSVTGSFVITDALNIESEALKFAKVRLGWSKVGNDADPYYNNGYYTIGSPYRDQPTLTMGTVKYDEKLKPEFTTEWEVGTELQFLSNRIGLDFTYYNRKSTDQIAPITLPYSTGYTRLWTNLGEVRNEGIEIMLKLTPVVTKDFRWNMNWMYTRNKNEIRKLYEGLTSVALNTSFSSPILAHKEGKPYGALYGTKVARDEEGNMLIDPTSGFYLVDTEEQYLGNPAPLYQTSLINTFTYKGISLSFMVDAQVGGKIYSTYMTDLLGRGVTKDTEDRYGSRILPGYIGDPATGKAILDANGQKIPNNVQLTESDLWFSSSSSVSSFATNGADEMAVYDATTIRLRELSIGYELPKKILRGTPFGSVNVSFLARNLWHYSPNVPKYSNYDPTVGNSYGGGNSQGIDYTSAPNTKRFSFNLRVTL